MNEDGQSWPEAMLSLVIVLLIFGSLLPLATNLASSVTGKKQAMIAAETSYQAAVHFKSTGRTVGRRTHEESDYDWTVNNDRICVAYEVLQVAKNKCVAL